MPQPYYFEHTTMPLPDRIALCPRCKTALVYRPENGRPLCYKCGNDEPGIPFVRLEKVLELLRGSDEGYATSMIERLGLPEETYGGP